VEKDKSFDPMSIGIGLLGPRTVVARTDRLAHLIEQFWFRRLRWRIGRGVTLDSTSVQWIYVGVFHDVFSLAYLVCESAYCPILNTFSVVNSSVVTVVLPKFVENLRAIPDNPDHSPVHRDPESSEIKNLDTRFREYDSRVPGTSLDS
jgi:hypothetical protein